MTDSTDDFHYSEVRRQLPRSRRWKTCTLRPGGQPAPPGRALSPRRAATRHLNHPRRPAGRRTTRSRRWRMTASCWAPCWTTACATKWARSSTARQAARRDAGWRDWVHWAPGPRCCGTNAAAGLLGRSSQRAGCRPPCAGRAHKNPGAMCGPAVRAEGRGGRVHSSPKPWAAQGPLLLPCWPTASAGRSAAGSAGRLASGGTQAWVCGGTADHQRQHPHPLIHPPRRTPRRTCTRSWPRS